MEVAPPPLANDAENKKEKALGDRMTAKSLEY